MVLFSLDAVLWYCTVVLSCF